ncbi:MAG: MerR family transcriptional regulator [Ruminococcaceae bacterium]|nr:MerR family transcriptional regulator [Oscillospiraceae bacterium]
MKIKEVCEKTNLTDRTIRLYMNYGLVFPNYKENYYGRKNYSFDENDVKRLTNIALLRKFGFSISSIKDMFENNRNIHTILLEHVINLENELEEHKTIIRILNEVSDESESIDSADALCDILTDKKLEEKNLPSADVHPPFLVLYDRLSSKFKASIVTILILTLVILCLCWLFNPHYTLYGRFAMVTDSEATDFFNKDNIGVYYDYSYRLCRNKSLFPHDASTLIANYYEEDFDNQKECIYDNYGFLEETVIYEADGDYMSPPPIFTIGNWTFKTIVYDNIKNEDLQYFPYSLQMIGINEKTKQIAYLDFYDSELDFIAEAGEENYMNDFIKKNFKIDFEKVKSPNKILE